MPDIDLLVPIGPKLPFTMQGKVLPVANPEDIGRAFGRGAKPQRPIYIYRPNGDLATIIAGMGVAEAAEIEELAVRAQEQAAERERKGQPDFDFEAARERAGYPSASKFDELLRDALQRKIKYHKQHARTDSGRKKYVRRVFQGGFDGR